MAESLDSRHGTSDEYIDPFCDTCHESEGRNVRVCGFCKDCVQFLCSGCYNVHGKLQGCRHHDVVHGEDMPKSQADKPPRFEYCDAHPKLLKNQFCCAHKILLCSVCSSADHNGCSVKSVEDVSETVDASETGALYDTIKRLQEDMKSSVQSLDTNIKKLKDQEKTMLDDAQNIYDQMVAKLTKLLDDIRTEIRTKSQSQISLVSRHQQKVNNIIVKLDSPLSGLADLKFKPVDTKVFLRLQEIVGLVMKFTRELQESRKTLNFVSLTLVPSQSVQDYWSSSFKFGSIQSSDSKPEFDIVVPEMSFPLSSYRQTATRSQVANTSEAQNRGGIATLLPISPKQLSTIKAAKQGTNNVRIKDDKNTCYITGMAITKDRRLLMVDHDNSKVKMFSHDMKFLSSVSVSGGPLDIAVISDKEAVVTTDNKSLVILDISGSKLSIKTTTQLSYKVQGISRYNDKLVVTRTGSKPEVKLIDQTGRVYWSVSSDQHGQPLFSLPWYVSCPGDGRSSTVIVTDYGNHTLTLLNGEVITRRQLKEKGPGGVTTDSDGNVYVCYLGTSEVAVLSGDLSEERILLSTQNGLSDSPQAIVYDDTTHQLIISYFNYPGWDFVDCFQLS